MARAQEALRSEKYINLETFKKDGNGVKTPVWFVDVDGQLLIFTDGTSYKVKRLQRNPKARFAACSASGKVHGEWFDATAAIVNEPALEKKVYDALARKYGIQYKLLTLGAKLSGSFKNRTTIAIHPA